VEGTKAEGVAEVQAAESLTVARDERRAARRDKVWTAVLAAMMCFMR
jgi:hypothetical protein